MTSKKKVQLTVNRSAEKKVIHDHRPWADVIRSEALGEGTPDEEVPGVGRMTEPSLGQIGWEENSPRQRGQQGQGQRGGSIIGP